MLHLQLNILDLQIQRGAMMEEGIYECELWGVNKCFLMPATQSSQTSIKWLFFVSSDYFLRIHGYDSTVTHDKFTVVTQNFDSTLNNWKGPLLAPGSNTRLHDGFIRILLDILCGLIYIKTHPHATGNCHGGINGANIFLVNGRAKIGVRSMETDIEGDDIGDFVNVVKTIFEGRRTQIPSGLSHLLKMIIIPEVSESSKLEEMLKHPILLNCPGKACLRIRMYQISSAFMDKMLITELRDNDCMHEKWHREVPDILRRWMELERGAEGAEGRDYFDVEDNYKGFMSFAYYFTCEACDYMDYIVMSYEIVEDVLEETWPNFLCHWFSAYIKSKSEISVVSSAQ